MKKKGFVYNVGLVFVVLIVLISAFIILSNKKSKFAGEIGEQQFALIEHYQKVEDEFFRERRHDIFDVGKRVLGHLTNQGKKPLSEITEPAIIVAHNLYPSDTLHLRESKVLGFCMDLGNKTSYTALLAQSMEIPADVGLSDVTRQIKTGNIIIVDGEQGIVIVSPGPEAISKYRKAQELEHKEERHLEVLRGIPAITRDGKKFVLMSNLDTTEDIKSVVALKTEGIGLLRTEVLYMGRAKLPSEEEQFAVYQRIVSALAPLPVVIRTADIGGDRLTETGIETAKTETNPFMGIEEYGCFLIIRIFLKRSCARYLRHRRKETLKLCFRCLLRWGNCRR